MNFEDITAGSRERPSLIEVILYEGVFFNNQASSMSCAYGKDKKSEKQGITLAGYVAHKDSNNIVMCPYLPQDTDVGSLGGWQIYKSAIHSIRELR